MPVVVECSIGQSKMRWYYLGSFTACGGGLSYLMGMPYGFLLVWIIIPFVAYFYWSSTPSAHRIRLSGSQVEVWHCVELSESYVWQGQGRLSHAFIRFELVDSNDSKYGLVIWKDSLSDVSWRALNMAFRVIQPSLGEHNQSSVQV